VAYVIKELEVIAGPAERGEGEKGKNMVSGIPLIAL